MTEAEIQRALNQSFRKSMAVIPNVYLFGEESDLLRIMKNGWVVEYEIKLSRSDFRADFRRKGKHKYMAERVVEPASYWYKNNHNHRTAQSPEVAKSWTIPNRFVFVCPEGLLTVEDMPEYAGLYYVKGMQVRKVKSPPLLHREKIGEGSLKRLVSVLSHRLWDLKLESSWVDARLPLPDTLRRVVVEIEGDEFPTQAQYDREKDTWYYTGSDMRIRGTIKRWREL